MIPLRQGEGRSIAKLNQNMAGVRKKTETGLVGCSAELPVSELPTLRNVLARAKLVKERSVGKISNLEVAKVVAEEVKKLYSKVNAVLLTKIISDRSLIRKIETHVKAEYEIENKKGKNVKTRKENLGKKLDKLFNILHCQCPFVDCETFKGCQNKACCVNKIHIQCTCPRDQKVLYLYLLKCIVNK